MTNGKADLGCRPTAHEVMCSCGYEDPCPCRCAACKANRQRRLRLRRAAALAERLKRSNIYVDDLALLVWKKMEKYLMVEIERAAIKAVRRAMRSMVEGL